MKDVLIHSSSSGKELTVIAENIYASYKALLSYLADSHQKICVLKEYGPQSYDDEPYDRYIIIGEQTCFSPWLEDVYKSTSEYHRKPEFVQISADEKLPGFTGDEVWTYCDSREGDASPAIRIYEIKATHASDYDRKNKNYPEWYLTARIIREEAVKKPAKKDKTKVPSRLLPDGSF